MVNNMNFQPADDFSLILFCIFSLTMFSLIIYFFRRANVSKAIQIGFAIYISIVIGLSASGLVQTHVLPLVPIIFLSVIALSICLAFSQSGTKIMNTYSLAALFGFMGFRLPLEFILHHWAAIGTVPETMTWTGQNWDVISGVLCLIGITIVNKSRVSALVIQLLTFALLINVLRVVVMSSPFPFSWGLSNPLQLALYFPYVLIAPLFVGPAIFCHMVIFRKIFSK